MKTLDEVIKNFEICRKARLNLISCDGCTYAIGDNDFCIDCNEIDVLEWLKGYKAHIELDKLRDKYGVTSQKLRNTSQITCPKCHSEFVILDDPDGDHAQLLKCQALLQDFYRNDPLTWDELKTMEGRPVWATFDNENGTWYIAKVYDDEVVLYEWGQEFGVRISGAWDYTPKRWQAYRKERSCM